MSLCYCDKLNSYLVNGSEATTQHVGGCSHGAPQVPPLGATISSPKARHPIITHSHVFYHRIDTVQPTCERSSDLFFCLSSWVLTLTETQTTTNTTEGASTKYKHRYKLKYTATKSNVNRTRGSTYPWWFACSKKNPLNKYPFRNN